MTQPIDIINGATLDIGARAAGETLPPEDVTEAFTLLNAMLDQWSNEGMMLYHKMSIIHELVGGTYQYTIGSGGDISTTFTGSVNGNTLTVTNIASGAMYVGMNISGTGIASGTTITSYGTGKGGNNTGALGTYFLNLPSTAASATITGYPPRPIKINSAIVRVVNSITGTLDYPVAVINLEKYELIGIKTLPGPWPRAVYYSPSEPLGSLNYWPNPSQGEMHLYCDLLLNRFQTINDTITLPQGFEMAMRANLAVMLAPSYGRRPEQISIVMRNAETGKAFIKRTNMAPQQTASFDSVLISGKLNDAGFILHGGFN